MNRINLLVISAVLAGSMVQVQAAQSALPEKNSAQTISLPLLTGWYEGREVRYITTDITDQAMAKQAGINYVPRLKYALRAPTPGQVSATDRVYKFMNFDQGSVFPSAPDPAGFASTSAEYTPLWVVYMVNWLPGSTPHALHSEQEISQAEEQKLIAITPTTIVVNCPILFFVSDAPPAGVSSHPAR